MEKDIAQGNIGESVAYDIEFKENKLSARIDLNQKIGTIGELTGSVKVSLGADELLTAIENGIRGKLDDAVIELIRGALKS